MVLKEQPYGLNMGMTADNMAMKQQDHGLNLSKRHTRKAVFLDEMSLVVPWSELLSLIPLSNLWMARRRLLQGLQG